jgi:hypothetical protein
MLRIGSRAQVMHGNAKMTGGGLKKKDLKYNKQGKIVSKKMSSMAKKEKRLQKAGYVTKKGQSGAVRNMRGGNWFIGDKYPSKYLASSFRNNWVDIIMLLRNQYVVLYHRLPAGSSGVGILIKNVYFDSVQNKHIERNNSDYHGGRQRYRVDLLKSGKPPFKIAFETREDKQNFINLYMQNINNNNIKDFLAEDKYSFLFDGVDDEQIKNLIYYTILDFVNKGRNVSINGLKDFYKLNKKFNFNSIKGCNISTMNENIQLKMISLYGQIKKNNNLNLNLTTLSNGQKKEYNSILKYFEDNPLITTFTDSHVLRYSNFKFGIYITGLKIPRENLYEYITCHKKYANKNTYITLHQADSEEKALQKIKQEADMSNNNNNNNNNNNTFKFYLIYIEDYTAPTECQLKTLWDILQPKDNTNSIIIHCTAGYGRTGTMLMSYIWLKKAFNNDKYKFTNIYEYNILIDSHLQSYITQIIDQPKLEIHFDTILGKNKNDDLHINFIELLYYLIIQIIQYSYESYEEIFIGESSKLSQLDVEKLLQDRFKIINLAVVNRLTV